MHDHRCTAVTGGDLSNEDQIPEICGKIGEGLVVRSMLGFEFALFLCFHHLQVLEGSAIMNGIPMRKEGEQ